MSVDVREQLIRIERERVQSLLDVDTDTFDGIHASNYQLCNPTGAVWSKDEYFDRLNSGRLRYRRLEPIGQVEVIAAEDLAVLRYRCLIELQAEGNELAHEAWHTDVYIRGADDIWRCTWSQATGIMNL